VNFFQPSFKLAEKERDGAAGAQALYLQQPPVNGCWQIQGPRKRFATSDRVVRRLDRVRLLSDMRTARSSSST